MKTYQFMLEQYVIINNIIGYIEFIGKEVIGLATNEKEVIYINVQNIKEVKFLNEYQLENYTIECEGELYHYKNLFN